MRGSQKLSGCENHLTIEGGTLLRYPFVRCFSHCAICTFRNLRHPVGREILQCKNSDNLTVGWCMIVMVPQILSPNMRSVHTTIVCEPGLLKTKSFL